jgi:hypothetical protein
MTRPPERCAWCDEVFAARSDGGRAQRFCSIACRRALDAAGRRWVEAALADGRLTPAALKNGHAATRALRGGAEEPAPLSAPAMPDPTLLAGLRRRGTRLLPPIAIDPEAIAQLASLGWFDPRDCHPLAVVHAITELCAAALFDAGLRPR